MSVHDYYSAAKESVRIPGVEMEVHVDREHLIDVEDPPGAQRPAVVIRAPAYVVGGLAHLMGWWRTVCDMTGGDGSEWAAAEDVLLAAAREAAGSDHYPELSDLSLLPPPPGREIDGQASRPRT
jgi:hypothetical protein